MTEATLQPPDLSVGSMASQPFRCGFLDCSADFRRLQANQKVPGTTRSTPTDRDCLAADTAQAGAWSKPCPSRASTQAPLPDFSVCHAPDQGTHRRPSRRLKSFLR